MSHEKKSSEAGERVLSSEVETRPSEHDEKIEFAARKMTEFVEQASVK